MKTTRKFLGSLILAAASVATVPAGTSFDHLLPADTDMVIAIDDVPRFLARWDQSPLGLAWADPQIQRFLAPLRRSMEIDRWDEVVRGETGIEMDELLKSFHGQALIVLPDFDRLEDNLAAILVEIGDDASLVRRLMARELEDARTELAQGEKLEEITEEFLGETLHIRRRTDSEGESDAEAWAVVEGFALMGQPVSYVRDLVSALKNDHSGETLSDRADFVKLRSRVPDSDFFLFVAMENLVATIEKGILESMDADPNPLGITGQAVVNALGLDALQSVFVSTTLAGQTGQMDFGVQYREKQGALRLLAYGPGPVQMPSLPPGAREASVVDFSISGFWTAVKDLLGTVNPMLLGMLQGQLASLSSQHGVDLEEALFGNLGNEFFTAKYPKEAESPGEPVPFDAMDQIIGFTITDRQSMELGLDALKGLAGAMVLFETSEFMGHNIFTLKQAIPVEGSEPQQVAYAVTDEHLLVSVGGQGPLRALLSGRKHSGAQVWDRAGVRSAVAGLHANPSGLSFSDTESALTALAAGCERFQNLMGSAEEEAGDEPTQFCDPAAAPDAAVFSQYFGPMLGAVFDDPGGLYMSLRMLPPEAR